MIGVINTTASTLKAVLCFIDPKNTPKIAYDNSEYAKPLADKVKHALGDNDGSQSVSIHFGHNDKELSRQFFGVIGEIKNTFSFIHRIED